MVLKGIRAMFDEDRNTSATSHQGVAELWLGSCSRYRPTKRTIPAAPRVPTIQPVATKAT